MWISVIMSVRIFKLNPKVQGDSSFQRVALSFAHSPTLFFALPYLDCLRADMIGQLIVGYQTGTAVSGYATGAAESSVSASQISASTSVCSLQKYQLS